MPEGGTPRGAAAGWQLGPYGGVKQVLRNGRGWVTTNTQRGRGGDIDLLPPVLTPTRGPTGMLPDHELNPKPFSALGRLALLRHTLTLTEQRGQGGQHHPGTPTLCQG